MEHPFLVFSLGSMLAIIFGFLWNKTKPVTSTADTTREPPPCSHTKKTSRIFQINGSQIQIALFVCPTCRMVLPSNTETITRITPEELREIRASLAAEGYDVSALPNPDA